MSLSYPGRLSPRTNYWTSRKDSPVFTSYTPQKQLHWPDGSGGSSPYRYRHNMSHSQPHFSESVQILNQLCLSYRHLPCSACFHLTVHRRSTHLWKPSPRDGVCESDSISAQTLRLCGRLRLPALGRLVERAKNELGALNQSSTDTIIDVNGA
jgi:hypothetical protein